MKSKIVELPGLIDVHVHLREPGATHKEDFESGTKAAVAGGYTQILDMPNNTPPTVSPDTISDKIKTAQGRIWCDVGFNFGASAHSTKYFNRIKNKVFGLKVYMNQTTGPLLINKMSDREKIFKTWQSELPLMVHAEGETVEIAIKLAKKYNRRLHVCHVVPDQLRAIQNAKKDSLDISCEVSPHHLFLNSDDFKRLGSLAMMKPPLLSKKDQERLWNNLDKIDIIASDHAPHTQDEKNNQTSPKFGVPGLETTLPLMLVAISKGLLTLTRLIEMTSTNPQRIFSLPDQPKTHVVVDLSKKYLITNKGLFTKCGWTPFVGLEGSGKVKKVVLRGKTIYDDGRFIGKPQGNVIYPG